MGGGVRIIVAGSTVGAAGVMGGRYGAGPNGGKTHLVMTRADTLADSAAERLAAYLGNE
ncbi:MAG: hypothetical protein O6951_06125 [Actinobacteria bacterium]|nr:hypothetical protein [Actinomycetota bacterium]